jgi:universal stress protein A
MSFKRMLIAIESSPIGARAVDVGVDLARQLGAEIALVRVTEPPSAHGTDAGILARELIVQLQKEDQDLIFGFRERLSLGSSVLAFVPSGDPATEIVRAAKEWPADVIVIGSHGRKGMARALLGSVAEAVTRYAPCPVLVVRAEK